MPAKKVDPLDALAAKFGGVMRQGFVPQHEYVKALSTGIVALDEALTIGGLPQGRLIEFWGPTQSGKTATSLHILAHTQRVMPDRDVSFHALEEKTPEDWIRTFGVKEEGFWLVERLPRTQKSTKTVPEGTASGELYFELLHQQIATGRFSLIVIDALPNIQPVDWYAGEMENADRPGAAAKLYKKGFGRAMEEARKQDTAVVLINHVAAVIDRFSRKTQTTSGGYALKHWKAVEVKIGAMKQQKTKAAEGLHIRATVNKNGFGPPRRTAEYFLDYHRGIDAVGGLVEAAMEAGIIHGSGKSMKVMGRIPFDLKGLKSALQDDDEFQRALWNELRVSGHAGDEGDEDGDPDVLG